ncbi:MAG: hypothetical protein E6K70_11695, partial [Planctomycetota bacterium]
MHATRLTALLAIWILAACHAAAKPPYERLLKGGDEKQAAALEKQIDDLWAAGKFADATVPA